MGKITAALDTSHYKGRVSKSVRVTTNDPAEPAFTLTLSAEVVRLIEVTPNDTPSLIGTPEQLRPAELTLTAADGKPFDITRVEADPRLEVSVTPAPVATGSSRYLVTVKAKPDVPVGRTIAPVTIATSHPRAATVPIRVNLVVQGAVQILPDRILFQPTATVQRVKLRKTEGPALAILGVESSDPELKATPAAVEEGREYDLAVEYTGQPGRVLNARITVRTNEPRQQAIVIPVVGRP